MHEVAYRDGLRAFVAKGNGYACRALRALLQPDKTDKLAKELFLFSKLSLQLVRIEYYV